MLTYKCINIKNLNHETEKANILKKIQTVNILIKINDILMQNQNQDIKDPKIVEYISELSQKNANYTHDLIVQFILKKGKMLPSLNQVLNEQLRFVEIIPQKGSKCDNLFYISLEESNVLVMSIFVSIYTQIKMQTHFYIIKDIDYILDHFIQQKPELKNAAILLHSFASDIFGLDYWCTAPLGKMTDILQNMDVPIIDDIQILKPLLKIISTRRYPCVIRDFISMCITTNDTKNIWNNTQYDIKVDSGDYIKSIIAIQKNNVEKLDGGYNSKYIKYMLKNIEIIDNNTINQYQ